MRRGLDALYPGRCMMCEAYTDGRNGLCPDCWRETSFITGARCECCATPLPGVGQDLRCDTCLSFPMAWHHGAAAVVYSGVGRRLVMALKHGDRLDLAPALAGWMRGPARDLLHRAQIIAPVPLHRLRLLKRRFNQSAELARHLAQDRPAQFIPDLLLRTRKTPSQGGLTREQRFENQQGAFALNPRFDLRGKSVLLVDDVMTTGATLSACAEACYARNAANVDIVVLARVEIHE